MPRLILHKIQENSVDLTDEEYGEYLEAKAKDEDDMYLDPYWSNMEEVNRYVEIEF